MSSNDEEQDARGKRRRIHRACDLCRRRKIRCDAGDMGGGKCTTCVDASAECTYLETAVKRVSPKSQLEALQEKVAHSKAVIRQLRVELAASTRSNTSTSESDISITPEATNGLSGDEATTRAATLTFLRTRLRAFFLPPPAPHGDDLLHTELARELKRLSLMTPLTTTFYGKGSGATLITAALDLKADVERHRPEHSLDGTQNGLRSAWTSRRKKYWSFTPWEQASPRARPLEFPPVAMMNDLIDLYFQHQNMYVPLLHRPTFERGVVEGLHLRNDAFGTTVLLVCAVASRWSADPEVGLLSVDTSVGTDGLAYGWRWFNQVRNPGDHMFGMATVYDLQYYCLAVEFLEGSASPQACWNLVGFGLRIAQDIGVHRRKAAYEVPTVEGELLKRAFWILVYMDRLMSSSTGKPCALEETDLDVEPPIECDDEFWEHPTRPFQQPPGRPSQVSFFNWVLQLNHLLSFSIKLLYPLNKTRAIFSVDNALEETLVAELDSALNRWQEQIPEHLRWDPDRADTVFFQQSVALQCKYYHLQIYIHKRFIPVLRSAPTGMPSLAVCTSAARACANLVDIHRRRMGDVPTTINVMPAFTAGIVLLLNMWSVKRTGVTSDASREFANVHKCMEVVRICEERWQSAGLLWDILVELASVGEVPLPDSAP
ncbi:fungal-specific transcription factor domain-containing protein, partial [Mycena filopes]